MKRVISASRRTDLVAFFPEWLSSVLVARSARIYGPSGHTYTVDLSPKNVHTVVLWSKNFSKLIHNIYDLRDLLRKYDQLYFHFTITGLGGSFIELTVPPPDVALSQLEPLIEIAGMPERISFRFDPIVYWRERNRIRTNLHFFEKIAPRLSHLGIKDVRFSFAQWYDKAKRRAQNQDFSYIDSTLEEKKEATKILAQIAEVWNLRLFSCSQDFLAEIPGVSPSACIDGHLLQKLHPQNELVSFRKDKSQRVQCRCTDSVDIGSYTQSCPHSCLYCYANPKV